MCTCGFDLQVVALTELAPRPHCCKGGFIEGQVWSQQPPKESYKHTYIHTYIQTYSSCPRGRIAHSSRRETDVERCRARRPIVPLCRSFRALACTSSLKWNASERDDESWIYVYDLETKQQSTVWVFQDESISTKEIRAKSTLKQMVACYFELFQEIRKNDRQRRTILHHDNASCHTPAKTTRLLEGQKIELTGVHAAVSICRHNIGTRGAGGRRDGAIKEIVLIRTCVGPIRSGSKTPIGSAFGKSCRRVERRCIDLNYSLEAHTLLFIPEKRTVPGDTFVDELTSRTGEGSKAESELEPTQTRPASVSRVIRVDIANRAGIESGIRIGAYSNKTGFSVESDTS
ncbi:hypothetical protein EVAR_80926_1 [Eumeta japonica]|uniref:Mariner Mos1 transposase n=1 Tax=Eumeta variegata TaxID=151549 RepID=A0A4C1V0Y1_EUMVA|nr:hypothetical protein EVAR_80926_1 [Eumeta japonica]